MQIQKKTILFPYIKAPEYQYKPLQQKTSDKSTLQMYYKSNPDGCFVRLVQSIFNDRYLYEHKHLRDKVLHHKKGYVDINDILNESIIKKFIYQMGQQRPNSSDLLRLVGRLSTKLKCNLKQIRRKISFENKIKYSKPLYIEQYPQNDGNQQLQAVLQKTGLIYKIVYNHSQNWATVYAQNPNNILSLQGYRWSIGTRLRIINYQKSQQTFDTPNIWGLMDLIKMHRHSLFDINTIIERYHDNKNNRIQSSQVHKKRDDSQQQYDYECLQQKYDPQYEMIDQQELQWRLAQRKKFEYQQKYMRTHQKYGKYQFKNQIEQRQKTQKQKKQRQLLIFKQKQVYFFPNFQFNSICLKYEQNSAQDYLNSNKLTLNNEEQINSVLEQFLSSLNSRNNTIYSTKEL